MHISVFFHSPWLAPIALKLWLQHLISQYPGNTGSLQSPQGCPTCCAPSGRDGEALPQMGGLCSAKDGGCKLVFVVCKTFCLSFCRHVSIPIKQPGRLILVTNFNGKCKWLLTHVGTDKSQEKSPPWRTPSCFPVKEHDTEVTPTKSTWPPPALCFGITQKMRFSDKTIAYSEKKPPSPLCSRVIASQHKLGKVQLAEWKKRNLLGINWSLVTINERQLKPAECGNHKHPGTYFPIHIIHSDKLKVIFCIILPPPSNAVISPNKLPSALCGQVLDVPKEWSFHHFLARHCTSLHQGDSWNSVQCSFYRNTPITPDYSPAYILK